MDVSGIMRPDELPFELAPDCREAVEELIDAMGRDDPDLDCYYNEVHAAARSQAPDEDEWVFRYYVMGGWRRGRR